MKGERARERETGTGTGRARVVRGLEGLRLRQNKGSPFESFLIHGRLYVRCEPSFDMPCPTESIPI